MSSDKTKAHRTLLEYIPSGAVALDVNSNVVYMNPSAEKMLKVSKNGVISKSFKEVLDSEAGKLFGIAAERVKEKRGIYTFYMKQEGERFIKATLSPIIQDDVVSGFLLIMDDVTEEVITSITTNKLIREMMDAISLSLKTLTGMLEKAHKVKNRGIEEELLPSLKQMEVNLKRIQEISPEPPQKVETDLAAFIRTTLEVIESKFSEKRINFVFNLVSFPKVFVTKSILSIKLATFIEEVINRARDGDVVWVKVDVFNDGKNKGVCVVVLPVAINEEDVDEFKGYIEKEGGDFVKVNFKDKYTGIAFSFPIE